MGIQLRQVLFEEVDEVLVALLYHVHFLLRHRRPRQVGADLDDQAQQVRVAIVSRRLDQRLAYSLVRLVRD